MTCAMASPMTPVPAGPSQIGEFTRHRDQRQGLDTSEHDHRQYNHRSLASRASAGANAISAPGLKTSVARRSPPREEPRPAPRQGPAPPRSFESGRTRPATPFPGAGMTADAESSRHRDCAPPGTERAQPRTPQATTRAASAAATNRGPSPHYRPVFSRPHGQRGRPGPPVAAVPARSTCQGDGAAQPSSPVVPNPGGSGAMACATAKVTPPPRQSGPVRHRRSQGQRRRQSRRQHQGHVIAAGIKIEDRTRPAHQTTSGRRVTVDVMWQAAAASADGRRSESSTEPMRTTGACHRRQGCERRAGWVDRDVALRAADRSWAGRSAITSHVRAGLRKGRPASTGVGPRTGYAADFQSTLPPKLPGVPGWR